MDKKEYIPINELKNNFIYIVDGRNFSVAVWKEKFQRFFGVRHKWGETFIDGELHWDSDKHHGTVKPLKEVRSYYYCPSCGSREDEELMKVLGSIEKEIAEGEKDETSSKDS